MRFLALFLAGFLCLTQTLGASVELGIDRLFSQEPYLSWVYGKRVGLVTNHTAVNGEFQTAAQICKTHHCTLVALFAPEHGIKGLGRASESIKEEKDADGVPIYSLHGETRRPTDAMLRGIDVLVYDIQDIGCRGYTYISTLFYVMEEAAKRNIPVVVADRPNPLGGIVDGPLLEDGWRSFIGYIRVPTCHGMTAGELARFFNEEYKVGCDLRVAPMKGWKRSMTFRETGLPWVPTSPQIPEIDTPLFFPATGALGEVSCLSIGVGYTLPFKVVGAPWIRADDLAEKLNGQRFPGVYFQPFHFRPFFGSFKGIDCQGVRLVVTDSQRFLPVATQFLILGTLKHLYPAQFKEFLAQMERKKEWMCKVMGTEKVLRILQDEKYVVYPLRSLCDESRKAFLPTRQKYLIRAYE